MKILDVGEPFDCTDFTYTVQVIVDRVLPCLSNEETNRFTVRNPGIVGFDPTNMTIVGVHEVVGNMVKLCSWSFFKICPGQLLEEADISEAQLYSEYLKHEIARSICLG